MTLLPTTWGELRKLAHDALAEKDFALADRWIGQMLEEAEQSGEASQLASAHFSLGMLRHAEGELKEAEEAFERTVDFDEEAHGSDHSSVAEALRSLGLVRVDQIEPNGEPRVLDRAVDAFRRSAEIYAECRPSMVSDVLACAARAFLRAERWNESAREYALALAAATRFCGAGHERTFWALMGVGEARRLARETILAYSTYSRATRLPLEGPRAKVADMRSRAWYGLGLVASCLKHGRVEASLAFSFARNLATVSSVAGACEARLRDVGGPAILVPPDEVAWRVAAVFGDTLCHLMHPELGHWIVRADASGLAPLGERVPSSTDVERVLREHAAFSHGDDLPIPLKSALIYLRSRGVGAGFLFRGGASGSVAKANESCFFKERPSTIGAARTRASTDRRDRRTRSRCRARASRSFGFPRTG